MSNPPAQSSVAAFTPAGPNKVAIPRLPRHGQPQNTPKERRRVSRACQPCRAHKIKCSGETPQCKYCATTNRECQYPSSRKDRLKTVTDQCVQMAIFLKELRSRANENDKYRIDDLLDEFEENLSDIRQMPAPSNPDTDVDDSKGSRDLDTHNTVSADHDEINTDSLDLLDENLQRDVQARATGFIGQNSVLQWLRTVAALLMDQPSEDPMQIILENRGSNGGERVSSFSFWTDEDEVEVDFYVDPYEFPAFETAERLVSCFLTKVQDSFPILPRKLFEDQFYKFFKALHNGNTPNVSPKWQAILNMVFAIGAKYSHLVKASWRADERDHLIYQARARAMAMNEYTLTEHPDVPQIQVLGLVAFYWFCNGHVSRAWTVIGLAVRCAYSLGLHVRNEDPSASAAKREKLVRIWWSLYSLERILSVVTGRPSLIVDTCCSVPLPIPVPEDQVTEEVEALFRMRKSSLTATAAAGNMMDPPRTPIGLGTTEANSGSYFKAMIQLSFITQDIIVSLYSAGTLMRSPNDIQQDMGHLNQRLDQWQMSLPLEFNHEVRSTPGVIFTRERIILGFQFCNAKMLLTRPCLGTLGRSSRDSDGGIMKQMANICIDAAKSTVDMLPEQPSPLFIYDQGPWWGVVHHLMQAYSVFLLALLYGSPMPQDNHMLDGYVKKIIRWLRAMHDPLAERAYRIALYWFDGVATHLSIDASDLWIENTMATTNRIAPNSDLGVSMPAQFDTMTYTDQIMFNSVYGMQPGLATSNPSSYFNTR